MQPTFLFFPQLQLLVTSQKALAVFVFVAALKPASTSINPSLDSETFPRLIILWLVSVEVLFPPAEIRKGDAEGKHHSSCHHIAPGEKRRG